MLLSRDLVSLIRDLVGKNDIYNCMKTKFTFIQMKFFNLPIKERGFLQHQFLLMFFVSHFFSSAFLFPKFLFSNLRNLMSISVAFLVHKSYKKFKI